MTAFTLLLISALSVQAQEVLPSAAESRAFKIDTQVKVALPPAKSAAPAAAPPATSTKPTIAAPKGSAVTLPTVGAGGTTANGTLPVSGAATPATAATPGGVAPSDVPGANPFTSLMAQPRPILMPAAAAPAAPVPATPAASMPSLGGLGGAGNPTTNQPHEPQIINHYYNTPAPTAATAVPVAPSTSAPSSTGSGHVKDLNVASAGSCGKGQNLWSAVTELSADGPLKPDGQYNIKSKNWPQLSSDAKSETFVPSQDSMCTSATATAFYKHINDLVNAGDLTLTPQQVKILNGATVHAAFNGNTFSVAQLYNQLGGASLTGSESKGDIAKGLDLAKPGDVLKLDRHHTPPQGHSTIFKDVEGNQVCYWSSNTPTHGTGVNCESISGLIDISISRFPSDLSGLPAKIDKLASAKLKDANTLKASDVQFASSLECGVASGKGGVTPAADGAGTPAAGK